jgi:hypothetical protein
MAPTEDDLPEKQLPSIPEEQTSASTLRDRLKNVARSAVRGNTKFEERTKRAIAEAEQAADFFKRNRFQGTADEKHQYLWTTATKALGKDYFDPVQHPDRTMRLIRFIGDRLYEDGHGIDEIRASYAKNPHTPGIKPDDPWLIQETQFDKSPQLNHVRTQINLWRMEHHPQAFKLENGTQNLIVSDKRSPLEVNLARRYFLSQR